MAPNARAQPAAKARLVKVFFIMTADSSRAWSAVEQAREARGSRERRMFCGQVGRIGSGRPRRRHAASSVLRRRQAIVIGPTPPGTGVIARSEERRVGKECRSRWSAYH